MIKKQFLKKSGKRDINSEFQVDVVEERWSSTMIWLMKTYHAS